MTEIKTEFCPKCLVGNKTKRHGRYGDFIGCTRYPYCDYIDKIMPDDKDDLEKQADEILRQNGKAELII
jgi:ssDNA-binding Zn-finger/Zn-ribbon topoisomerase 1